MARKQTKLSKGLWQAPEIAGVQALRPEAFGSLADFVRAVAEQTDQADARKLVVIHHILGLCNVTELKTLAAVGRQLGGLTRERIRQIATTIDNRMFAARGRVLCSEFVRASEAIFAQHNGLLRAGEYLAGLNARFPFWKGTTEFSALRLLCRCGATIERNDSGLMAWMADGVIARHYATFLALLDDVRVPLGRLTEEEVLRRADRLRLDGITSDEYRFLVQRVYDRRSYGRGTSKPRWDLFIRLQGGIDVNRAERRRLVVTRALKAAGMRGLTHDGLVAACRVLDPDADIGTERQQDSDANPLLKIDMDGRGTHLIIFDFGDRRRAKRFTLDSFFTDEQLLRTLQEAGARLRAHMERNRLGVANATRLIQDLTRNLPGRYSAGLPSACLYRLMRECGAGGLKYYNHPNVAHPAILDARGNPPHQAISWMIYEYFRAAGYETATFSQLMDFCTKMLGMDRVIAAATVIPPIKGRRMVNRGITSYCLKVPNAAIEPPNVLLSCGEVDARLSFSAPRHPYQMDLDSAGRAHDFNTYVRLFLHRLSDSGYTLSQEEQANLSDAAWCRATLGLNYPLFLVAQPDSPRPSSTYWRMKYSFGGTKFWVKSHWNIACKDLFDAWAQETARRAGIAFEPYDLPCAADQHG